MEEKKEAVEEKIVDGDVDAGQSLDISDVATDNVDIFSSNVTINSGDDDEEKQLQEYAYKVIKKATQLKAVRIEREKFLRAELSKHCPEEQVDEAVATSPARAGIDSSIIEKLAHDAIGLETKMVSGLSFLAGLPGGFAMAATVPLDTAQYFAYSLRIEQKLAYLYGWESFLDDKDDFPDETIYQMILFLGVMMGVGGSAVALEKFATNIARQGVIKAVQKQALTKTTFYPILKKILSVLGVKMTKETFAKGVGKLVPVAGGVISGGMTFATFKPGAKRLAKHLATLPQAKA